METEGVKWTDVAEIVISLIGFVFVVYQVWRLKLAIQGDTHGKLYDHYLKVNELLLDRPHLRPYFYECKQVAEPARDTEETTLKCEIEMMCEVIVGLLEHATLQKDNLPGDSWDNCWKAYIHERFKQSPELKKFFARNREWYAQSFREVVES